MKAAGVRGGGENGVAGGLELFHRKRFREKEDELGIEQIRVIGEGASLVENFLLVGIVVAHGGDL
jgi:hypothetical protein